MYVSKFALCYTLIVKDSFFSVYLNDKVTLFVLGENHITVRESVI